MKKVLYIEDSIETQDAVKDYFSNHVKEEVYFTCVTTAKEGISQIKGNKFDIILLDVSLPNFEGDDVFLNKEISKLKKEKEIPLIIFSGLHKYIQTVGKTDLGLDFDEWITKPNNLSKLKNVLMAYVS